MVASVFFEKDFVLDPVERARDLLTKAGFNVRLTRSADVFVPLEDRAAFANRQSNAVFVSVHFNAGAPDAGGVETYSMAPRGVPSTNSANLSLADFQACVGNIRDPENIALATAIHAALITKLGVTRRCFACSVDSISTLKSVFLFIFRNEAIKSLCSSVRRTPLPRRLPGRPHAPTVPFVTSIIVSIFPKASPSAVGLIGAC